MRTTTGVARKSKPLAEVMPERHGAAALLRQITTWLDDAKAEEIVTIDLMGKSSMSDFMVIASGRSDRHVGAIAEQVYKKLKEDGWTNLRMEGQPQCDWVVIDTGDIIVHVFRPEVRAFYNLEKMWSQNRTSEPTAH